MPEITVSDDQLTYLDTLREELAAEHAGPYGTVRRQDVLQYLIDSHEDDIDETVGSPDVEASAESETDDGPESVTEHDAAESENDEDRLNAMMNLLETHDDKWEEADGDDGRYAVELPDGEVEHVRTKDDIRAVLFKNY